MSWLLHITCTLAAATDAGPSGGIDLVTSANATSDNGAFTIYDGTLIVLGASMLCTLWRLVRGPTLADRVIALDLLAFFAAGVIAVAAVSFGRGELLIVAVVVALLTFMGTAAFAMFLERKGRADAE
jgi:multicomponent Na+:H+ antiporter subunit F